MTGGTVITFYSWKGGVGRSMALANVAVQLAQRGRSVLMVDWDLEAPGLDKYFLSQEASSAGVVISEPVVDSGLIGLLGELAADSNGPTDAAWRSRLRHIGVPQTSSPAFGTSAPTPNFLHLLPSGESSDGYAQNLATFSWQEFYGQGGGSARLERLRGQWASTYDFVLIDSRTGLTDSGGVCTIQLPDWLVLVFTGNEQSLGGGLRMIEGVQTARRDFAFDRMPLNVLPLLSRWDGEKEVDLGSVWLDRASAATKGLFAPWLPKAISPRRFFERVRIPHLARFSFGEPLPVITHSLTDESLPGAAYARIAQLFDSNFLDVGRMIDPDYRSAAIEEPNAAGESDNFNKFRSLLADEEALTTEVRAQEQALSGESSDLANYLSDVGKALRLAARFTQAEPLLRRALSIVERLYDERDPKLATALSNLAAVLHDTRRHADAEMLYKRALEINESHYGPSHPKIATDLSNLAGTVRRGGRVHEAIELYTRALAIDEEHYGRTHSTVGTDLNNLAEALRDVGRSVEAEPLYRRALSISESIDGATHPRVALKLNNLANLLRDTGRLIEAEALFRRALAIEESNFGPAHPKVATKLNNLAGLLCETGSFAEAEVFYRRALEIDIANYGDSHPDVATDMNNLGKLLCDMERFTEAEPLIRRALAIDNAVYGASHPEVATDLNALAMLMTSTGNLNEAETLYLRARHIDEAALGTNHPLVARDIANLAGLLRLTGRYAEAEALYLQAISIDEGADRPARQAMKLSKLAQLYLETNRIEEGINLCRQALADFKGAFHDARFEHPKFNWMLDVYSSLHRKLGNSEEEVSKKLAEFR